MGKHGDKPDFSRRTLDLAERGQAALYRARGLPGVKAVEAAFVGSSSPAYVQAQWRKQPHIRPADIAKVRIPGDTEASRLMRRAKYAAVLAVRAAFYDQAVEDHDKHREAFGLEALRPGVAYVSQDMVRVGELPVGTDFGTEFYQEVGGNVYTVAMRKLRGDLVATMGPWSPTDRRLVTPSIVHVLNPHIRIDELPEQYPDTPLV